MTCQELLLLCVWEFFGVETLSDCVVDLMKRSDCGVSRFETMLKVFVWDAKSDVGQDDFFQCFHDGRK